MGLDVKTLAAAKSHTKESLKGAGAVQGQPGKDGIGVSTINKISTKGLIDTYQIALTNGNKYTFTITNGKDGDSPSIDVDENDNWIINGIDTGVSAKGIKGDTGTGFKIEKQYNSITEMMSDTNPVEESVMVVVIENNTGFLYLRLSSYTDPDGKTDGYLPFGSISDVSTVKGEKGDDGITPHIDPITKHWFLGTSDTGMKATGENGTDGNDGVTPHIDSNSKHWMIGGNDTGIVAEGTQGKSGENGKTPYIGENGNWWFGDTDSGIPIPSINNLLEYTDENNGITDTPIGHIISVMSNSAPDHYLICDGSEYNISDYPYLAKHFADEFEQVNYFGGDGNTTFAVPDLRGEFLRGTGTATRNTGSGSKVGLHQDATQTISLGYDANYKTFYHGANGSISGVYDAEYNCDKLFYSNNTIGRSVRTTDEYAGDGVRSYSSRPTNTSVLYCIKYEPTYFIKSEITDKKLEYTDISGGIIPNENANISFIKAYVENGVVSICMSANFTKTNAVTFANISEKYAPREDTLGIFYGGSAAMVNNEITYAKVNKDGRIYCYINKIPNMTVDFQFTYPLKTS